MLIYIGISLASMLIGYAFSVSIIMKQSDENVELRVQLLEILNRERMLLDEYREFVIDTKLVNSKLKEYFDNLVK